MIEEQQEMFFASRSAGRTHNPIRHIVDKLKPTNTSDPTIFGNMDCHEAVNEAVRRALTNPKNNGYGPAIGLESTREAVAEKYAKYGIRYSANDVFMTCGCSHSLQMAICATVNEGESLLLPKPGFSIYHTIAGHYGCNSVFYSLVPSLNWEIDLHETERLIIEHRPKVWLINNPSNPCGSVYSKSHLQDCLVLAKKHDLLIISDEIYEDICFTGQQYHPMAALADEQPVISCSGLAKRFMIPGWRIGWITIHDPLNQLSPLRKAFFDLSGLILGPCTLIQAAIPDILNNVPDEFNLLINKTLEENARIFVDALEACSRVKALAPQGTLYMMIKLSEGTDDVKWCQDLLAEENLLILPGTVFLVFTLIVL